MLAAVAWSVLGQVRGRQAWPFLPSWLRRCARLAIEIVFGLINPVIYLAILTSSFPPLRSTSEWAMPLFVSAGVLLTLVWTVRLVGSAVDQAFRPARTGVGALLILSMVWLIVYMVKDAALPRRSAINSNASRWLGRGLRR